MKGALFFTAIDELLLQLYIYENSSKKCRVVVEELKGCFESSELPASEGTRPLHAGGTWFIAHKVAALGRLVDRLGAYLAHLITMSEDSSFKAEDKELHKKVAKLQILAWECFIP